MQIPGDDRTRLLETVFFGVKKTDQKGPVRSSDQKGEAAPTDRVEISGEAKEYQQLNQVIGSLPEVRSERVAALQQEIEAGTYHPQSEEIAEKLVRSTLLDAVL
ncbi:flagellar biosynthesis anti-sigma factor FlgM [Candidatus Manganitrophus noduliformans]|uniref:Negative regulator of flagellin synthesis n=1 Tax=Candidatus Manganitrophus noduliformans TaxID=2606439 RepID=A0A7X6DTG7_9BACT|nr:flagellar biosynthesis anti-sigma factor FlgM [Candidatus Manganitrophus noduliformans]NKE73092.1 flagellar biosynthesis anti-sigma factor FlgM [Candidatus Manganitrophus noduliformans]